jgi:bifunctional ADP-heptose synthase (sugar kinase/adenylyltransferase)
MARHDLSIQSLKNLVADFANLRVLTIGNLIIDDYIDCEPLGMSQEDPSLVVSPIERRRFDGGAGIVAAHEAGLGAVILPFLTEIGSRVHAAMANRCFGVIPPKAMFGRS